MRGPRLHMGWMVARTSFIFVAVCGFFVVGPACAEIVLDPWFDPQNVDLGNIASDGSGGRQTQIRPFEADEIGQVWKFFSPHYQLPEYFPDPPPPTPAQDDIFLTAGTPLILVLPQLQHFPNGADVSVSHAINGQQIIVDASIHYLGFSTATIYGPHEYLHPLGALDAGQYRLTLNFAWSSEFGPPDPSITTGHIDFVVHAIPEPSSLALICSSVFIMLLVTCHRTRENRLTNRGPPRLVCGS